jgi:hypothetical protein
MLSVCCSFYWARFAAARLLCTVSAQQACWVMTVLLALPGSARTFCSFAGQQVKLGTWCCSGCLSWAFGGSYVVVSVSCGEFITRLPLHLLDMWSPVGVKGSSLGLSPLWGSKGSCVQLTGCPWGSLGLGKTPALYVVSTMTVL